MDADDLDRELWQIDENLIRAELTEIERTDHLRRRKEIFKAKKKLGGTNPPTSLSDGRKAGPQHQKGFDKDTADKIARATVARADCRTACAALSPRPNTQGRGIAQSKNGARSARSRARL